MADTPSLDSAGSLVDQGKGSSTQQGRVTAVGNGTTVVRRTIVCVCVCGHTVYYPDLSSTPERSHISSYMYYIYISSYIFYYYWLILVELDASTPSQQGAQTMASPSLLCQCVPLEKNSERERRGHTYTSI